MRTGMRRIKEKAARLKRYPRGRGFGVQSPNDYNFITKVVKGHIDSDCCKAIDNVCPDNHGDKYKFAHLCYRVAQYLKPVRCLCLMPQNENIRHYVQSAVPGICFARSMDDNDIEKGRCLVIMSPAEDLVEDIEAAVCAARENVWMIIDGIRRDNDTYRCWLNISGDSAARITFDLYHYGIICFDKKRYKQNYKIYL